MTALRKIGVAALFYALGVWTGAAVCAFAAGLGSLCK